MNNKRIAKNTILLYIRTVVMILISLYTSRIVLQVLGSIDYGIYAIVGGVITMFAFFNNSLTTAIQRFINIAIGKGTTDNIQEIFSTSINIFILILIFVFILGETLGLWYVDNYLNIPFERFYAAKWIFQISLINFLFSIARIPYNSVIIAYEKMDFYAYVSIAEAMLKLIVVFFLKQSTFDKLIIYSILNLAVSIVILIIYIIYCRRMYTITIYKKCWNKELMKKMLSFSGWNLFGSTSMVACNQGTNLSLNYFGGVIINAAVGIANQISSQVYSFIMNFQMAFKPQIIKLYASDNLPDMILLIFRASKYSSFLVIYIIVPLIISSEYILKLWLGNVPHYTIEFSNFILVYYYFDSILAPLTMGIQATGNIKTYQIINGIILLLSIPLIILLLYFGYDYYWVWLIKIIANILIIVFALSRLKTMIELDWKYFLRKVIYRSILIFFIAFIVPYKIFKVANTFITTFEVCIFTLIFTSILIYLFGLEKNEKKIIIKAIKSKKQR